MTTTTFPRVLRPTSDTCVNDGSIGYVWLSTEDGDRPICRECFETIIVPTEDGTHVTTETFTSEWGNVYRMWCQSDHERVADEIRRHEDEAGTSTGDECTDECADSGSHTLTDGCSMCVYVHEDGTTCEGDECTADLVHYTADEDGTPYALTRTMFTEDEAR